MVVTKSVRVLSWHGNVHACTLMFFFPYPIHKLRLMSSFSYLWLWHLSVLKSCNLLSVDYVCVQLVHFIFFFCLQALKKLFKYHFTLYPRCILSCLLLSPYWIWFFLLLYTCWGYIYSWFNLTLIKPPTNNYQVSQHMCMDSYHWSLSGLRWSEIYFTSKNIFWFN